jgi:hypothetical protein
LCLTLNRGAVYDYGAQMRCKSGTDEEIEVLVRLAKEKGWSGIHLTGSDEFKERVFVRAVRTGAFKPEQISGYTPTAEALALIGDEPYNSTPTLQTYVQEDEEANEYKNQPKKLKL